MEKEKLIMINNRKWILNLEDFILNFYDDDVYLLHICEQWQNNNRENSLKQIRYFINLKKLKQEQLNNKAKFWIIDYDLHSHLQDKPINSVIYYVTRSTIKSKDFYKDSLSKFIIIISQIIENNLSLITY